MARAAQLLTWAMLNDVKRLHCLPCSNCNTESDSRFVYGFRAGRNCCELDVNCCETERAANCRLPSVSWLALFLCLASVIALFVWQSQLGERDNERAKEAPDASKSAEGGSRVSSSYFVFPEVNSGVMNQALS